jgi:hypothetical protein
MGVELVTGRSSSIEIRLVHREAIPNFKYRLQLVDLGSLLMADIGVGWRVYLITSVHDTFIFDLPLNQKDTNCGMTALRGHILHLFGPEVLVRLFRLAVSAAVIRVTKTGFGFLQLIADGAW